MTNNNDKQDSKELDAWIKNNLNDAVQKLIDKGDVDSVVVEAKPAWVLPFQILIGKIRTKGQLNDFQWFICGEVPTDYIESSVAKIPREAARHFSMKWQLTASKYQGKNIKQPPEQIQQEDVVNNLIDQAQALYEVVEHEALWPNQ